jgi:hypothetical protein
MLYRRSKAAGPSMSSSSRPPGQAHADGRAIEDAPKNSAESFRDTDIETLNREQNLNIDVHPRNFTKLIGDPDVDR